MYVVLLGWDLHPGCPVIRNPKSVLRRAYKALPLGPILTAELPWSARVRFCSQTGGLVALSNRILNLSMTCFIMALMGAPASCGPGLVLVLHLKAVAAEAVQLRTCTLKCVY